MSIKSGNQAFTEIHDKCADVPAIFQNVEYYKFKAHILTLLVEA